MNKSNKLENSFISKFNNSHTFWLGIIYLSGYIALNSYYAYFGVNITTYISLLDIVLFILENSFKLVLISFGVFLLFEIPGHIVSFFFSHNKSLIIIRSTVQILLLIISVLLYLLSKFHKFDLAVYSILAFSIFIFYYFLDSPILSMVILGNHKIKPRKLNIKTYLFIFMITTCSFSVVCAKARKHYDFSLIRSDVEFSLNDKKYSTELEEFIFIGETSRAVFLYNTIEKKSIVFLKSALTSIKFTDHFIY